LLTLEAESAILQINKASHRAPNILMMSGDRFLP
jgi:hypothetical protein